MNIIIRKVEIVLYVLLVMLPASSYAEYYIGKKTMGSLGINFTLNLKASRFQAVGSGTVTYVVMWINGGGGNLRVALYNHHASFNRPNNLMAESATVMVTSGWTVVTIPTTALVDGQFYWLVFQSDSGVRGVFATAVGTQAGLYNSAEQPVGAYPDPFPSTNNVFDTQVTTIYATDTDPSTPTPSVTVTLSNTMTPTPTMTSTISSTPTITPSFTQSPTKTVTPTHTITATPMDTSTVTPTLTITHTSTPTPTKTITLTASASATFTSTDTITITSTQTPYFSTTPTPTLTASRTKTVTATATLFISSTVTPTSTITPSVTMIPTWLPESADYIGANPIPARGNEVYFNYFMNEPGSVQIDIYNIIGEKVTHLNQSHSISGRHQMNWIIQNVSSGVYLYQLKIIGDSGQEKLIPIKKMIIDKP